MKKNELRNRIGFYIEIGKLSTSNIRNITIAQEYINGKSMKELAESYKISIQRIHQILVNIIISAKRYASKNNIQIEEK